MSEPKTPKAWKSAAPKPRDILLAYFPYDEDPDSPGPESHPVLVLAVDTKQDPIKLLVAYGSSQGIENLDPWEFVIPPLNNVQAKRASGLDKPTRFNLLRHVQIYYNNKWFKCASTRNTPRFGCMDPQIYSLLSNARIQAELKLGSSLIPGKPPLADLPHLEGQSAALTGTSE